MPDAGVELTIHVKQEGMEEAQGKVEVLKGTMREVRTEASLTEKITSMSISKFVLTTSIIVNIGLATFDVLGVAVDNTVKAMVQTLMNYALQLGYIAMAHMSAGNVAAAITLTTIATTIQIKGIVEAERLGREAKAQLVAGQRELQYMSQLIRTVG